MQLLNHGKTNPETRGHEYQEQIVAMILAALDESQRQKITVKLAQYGSTLPDIRIYHADHGDDCLSIECKLNNSQSGGISWTYDGKSWNYSQRSKKAATICESDPNMLSLVMESLNSTLVRGRITQIQSSLAEWFPELKSDAVPFSACKEFWNALLDKHPIGDEGDVWYIPMDELFWATLNSLFVAAKDQFLHIEGCGLFRVDGVALPSWFQPSDEFTTKVPLVSAINEPPKGNLELRLKQGGMKGRKLQTGRKLQIRSTIAPKLGQYIHVAELGSLGRGADYLSPIGLIVSKGKHATYIANSAEAGCIGQLEVVHSISKHSSSERCDEGESVLWVVECDLSHRIGTISFETNLRILDISARSGINLENDSKEFCSFI